jgi:hypothetical protein
LKQSSHYSRLRSARPLLAAPELGFVAPGQRWVEGTFLLESSALRVWSLAGTDRISWTIPAGAMSVPLYLQALVVDPLGRIFLSEAYRLDPAR